MATKPKTVGPKVATADATANAGNFSKLKAMTSDLLRRAGLASLFSGAYGGKRDYNAVFGYPDVLDVVQMWEMYHRGGIANRIIHAYPDAVWARPPELYVEGNPDWVANWNVFVRQTKLWDALRKADILAGMGRFSVVLVGTTNGNLLMPLRKGATITYLQPYSEMNVQISVWETDPTSPRFGMPLFYTIYPNKNRTMLERNTASFAPVASSFKVHYSRIWHIVHGSLESPVFGVPRFAPVWNYLLDMIKIVGSSAESYWMTAYQGIHANIDSEMDMLEDDASDLSDEIDEYQHGLRRFIRTRGVDIKTLGSKVADPKGAFDVVLTLISGATGIPKRILIGSEAGQLASAQDKGNWAERVEEERATFAEPDVILPILQWLNDYGVMDVPIDDVQFLWPEAYRMSPLERGQTAAQTARTATNLQKAMAPVVITPGSPGTPDTTDPVTGEVTPGTPATPDITGEALITRDEARKIIGLSTDQQALENTPM